MAFDREKFKDEVFTKVLKLNIKDRRHFAWRCAIRALPFLGYKGNFDFWKAEDRQKHLYVIFNALDAAAYAYAADAYAAAYAAANHTH